MKEEIEETHEELLLKRELMARKYSQSSINTYVACLRVLMFKADRNLDTEKIKDFLVTVQKRSYHKQFVAAIRNYYKFVLKKPLDFSDLPYPRKEEKIPEVFSVDEMRKIVNYPKNHKHQLVICLLYNCGLRIGELLELKPQQINRARMEINIKEAKGNKERNIPIDASLLGLMERYYREYRPAKYVFNGQKKDKYTESSVNKFLKYYAEKCGINKRIHAHKLRHCYATHLHESGVELSIIQELLGHNDIKTTEIYTKTSQARKRVPSLLINMNV